MNSKYACKQITYITDYKIYYNNKSRKLMDSSINIDLKYLKKQTYMDFSEQQSIQYGLIVCTPNDI